jgi:hypothetical protein
MEHGKIAKRPAPGVALRRVISSKQSFFSIDARTVGGLALESRAWLLSRMPTCLAPT